MNTQRILFIACLLPIFSLQADIVTENISYSSGGTVMKGMIAYDNSIKKQRPGVLVVHEWWGHNDYARKRARMLAELGYTALAVDMYGEGKTAEHPEDAGKFSAAVGGNLPLAKARFESAINELKQHSSVDAEKLAAIGYCFGGGIVLQMARQGVDLDGAVSFHGSVATKNPAEQGDIKAKIRVFNGEADSFVTAEQITAFKQEMDKAGADYQFVNYPGAKHSFTNPAADAFGKRFNLPLAYDKNADEKSWDAMQAFFSSIFSE